MSPELETRLRFGSEREKAGQLVEAEAAYREVLDAARRTGSPLEREATVSLARLCGNDGREFEAIALALRARDLSAAAGDLFRLALAQLQFANALDAVEDYARIPDVLDRVARGLDLLEPVEATRLRLSVALHRARLAANLGQVEAALAALVEVDAASRAVNGQPAPERITWFVHVVALNAAGRHAEVEPWLAVAPASGGMVRRELEYAEQRVRCLLALRPEPDGLTAAAAFLDAVIVAPHTTVGAAWRLRAVADLGTRLATIAGASTLARTAWDIAGHAMLLRVAQIEQCVRSLPELAGAGTEVLDLLTAYRSRFRERHEQLLREVGAARPWPPVDRRPPAPRRGMTVVCAWCARVRADDGAWMPIRQFVPSEQQDFKLSHGICAACWERTVGDLKAYARTQG